MKIGVDIRVLMDQKYSGISYYTANLLSALLKEADDSKYHLFYNSFDDIENRMKKWEGKSSKLVFSSYPNKLFNYFGQKLLAYPKIDKLLGDIDIFWSPHFNFTSLKNDNQHVLTIHDLSFMRYPNFFSCRKNFWHQSINLPKLAKNCRALVAVSKNTRDDIIELLKVPVEKVHLIYSGLNTEKKDINKEKINLFFKKHGLKPNFILYLGNIEPRKNISGLIYAYNLLRDANVRLIDTQLVLAGQVGWKNRDIFQARENSPYKNDIKFIGYVDEEEKEILYKESIFLSYPSFYEGFGFPPLEAMARSLPVITSNVSSLPEVVENSAITINPYDVNDLAKTMELLIYNQDLRTNLINKGKEQVKKFSWGKAAKQYLDLFKYIKNEK